MAVLCLVLLTGTQCAPDATGPDALEPVDTAVGGAVRGEADGAAAVEGGLKGFISIQPGTDTIPTVGDTLRLRVAHFVAEQPPVSVAATWVALNPTIARIAGDPPPTPSSIRILGVAKGVARFTATYQQMVDTAVIWVAPSPVGAQPKNVIIQPDSARITVGAKATFTATVRDSVGAVIPNLAITWSSLDPTIATPTQAGVVSGLEVGTARIVAGHGTLADTARVIVTATPAKTYQVVLSPSQATISAPGGTIEFTATVSEVNGPIVSNPALSWLSLNTAVASVNSTGLVTGVAAGTARIIASFSGAADTAVVTVNGPPPPPPPPTPAPGGQRTPANLMATAGPLVARQATTQPLAGYDSRYPGPELSTYNAWVAGGRRAADGSSHYGALRSRYQWSLRNGLPVGPGAPSNSVYTHGVEMTRAVLRGYFKPNNYGIAAHNATNLPDVEMLYVLEGDPEARAMFAGMGRYLGASYIETYFDLSNPNSDPRQSAVLLQVLNFNARYNLPYNARPSWGSTWKQAAATIVGRLAQRIDATGKVVSLAHKNSGQGDEAFFMNAMLATELLRWHGFVEPQPGWLDLARRIVDHLIDEDARRSGACLPYTSNSVNPAWDLAAYYVWPALVLWQETGDAKYRTFALANMDAARNAFVSGVKQFNQTYSTGAQSVEALLSGVRWR